jgi:hypothetical protein
VFAKVMLAIAILVANGVLLFVILRFLLWLAFPGMKDGDKAAAAPAAPPAGGAAAAADLGSAPSPPPAAPVPVSATPGLPLAMAVGQRARAYPHRLLIGLPVILALFAGGVWLGSVVGHPAKAAAATTVTIKVKGKVVRDNGTTKEVRVPAQTVTNGGNVVTVAPTTVTLPAKTVTNLRVIRSTRTTTTTTPGRTTVVTTTITIPTTVTGTGTTTTVTQTTTETVTTTGTTATSTATS